jgi:hypothetical protein
MIPKTNNQGKAYGETELPNGPQNAHREPWEWPEVMCKELWELWFLQNPQEKKILPIDLM